MMRAALFLIIVGALASVALADLFFITAPDVIHFSRNETVSVNVLGSNANTPVKVYIEDYPARSRKISQTTVQVPPNTPQLVEVKVEPSDLDWPDEESVYVYLVAEVAETGFKKEAVVFVSTNSYYVFIQTDKPIYRPTPRQKVFYRVFTMDDNMRPVAVPVTLDILNPSGMGAARQQDQQSEDGIINARFTLPKIVREGNWSLVAFYGYKNRQSVTAKFEVREYVLPTFSVKIHMPEFILPTDNRIIGYVEAKHTYGEPVAGRAQVKLEVVQGDAHRHFLTVSRVLDMNGIYSYSVNVSALTDLGENYQFPSLEGALLQIEATVTNVYTGKSQTSIRRSTVFASSPYKIKFSRTIKYFKPALPYVLQMECIFANGKAAGNVALQVSATAVTDSGSVQIAGGEDEVNEVTSDERGWAQITLNIPRDAQSLTIAVRTVDPDFAGDQQGRAELTLTSSSSPSNSYLLVTSSAQMVRVGDILEAEVFVNRFEDVNYYINYMVVGRGKILYQRTVRQGGIVRTLQIPVTQDMSPSIRFLVYYVRGNNEVVADSVLVDVVNQCQNPVSLEPDQDVYGPRHTTRLRVSGTPGSKVALLAVDQALYVLSDKNYLTHDSMFKRMEDFDLGCTPGGGQNTQGVFQDIGLTTINNAGLDIPQRAQEGCPQLELNRRKRSVGRNERAPADGSFLEFLFELIQENEDDMPIRSKFPESWLFLTVEIREEGFYGVDVTFPDSVTKWSLQAVGVSSSAGMCVAPPADVTIFRNFLVHVDMPYSAVHDEQIEIRATLYNYRDDPIGAIMYLTGDENICYGARTGENTEQIRLTVQPNSAKQVAWPIVPLATGDFPIRVKAFTNVGGDIVEKILHVAPKGVQRRETTMIVLDPSGEMPLRTGGTPAAGAQNGEQLVRLPLVLPAETVPGSAHCFISFYGAATEPVIQAILATDTLEPLIRLPTGSGETTLSKLGPLVYAAKYLKETDQMTGQKERQVYGLIRQGVTHEMTFIKVLGGGFATYRHYPPSTWLTAFAAKVFSYARVFNAFGTDPSNVICTAVHWLTWQQEQSGAYRENRRVLTLSMTGGVQGEVSLTAYVLIGALEANCQSAEIDASLNRAISFLENQVTRTVRPYQAAITAYALALAQSDRRNEANIKLRDMAVYDQAKNTRFWPANTQSLGAESLVETAGYAILAQIENGDIAYASPIVNWLVAQIKDSGGFISTQDSVIGLQALSYYRSTTSRPDLHLECTIFSEMNTQLPIEEILVDQENAYIKQEIEVTRYLGGELIIDVRGVGVGQAQVELLHNVHDVAAERCLFDLTVNAEEFVPAVPEEGGDDLDVDCSNDFCIRISSCLRDLGEVNTQMAILDVGLFTGFAPVIDDLETMKQNASLGIGRYELNDRSVVFYLDTVPTDRSVCINFTARRNFQVGITHAVAVSVSDYYQPDQKCIKFYHPEFSSPHLLKFCANDQCVCAESKCGNCYSFGSFDERPWSYGQLMLGSCRRGIDYVMKITIQDINFDPLFEAVTARVEQIIKAGGEAVQTNQTLTFWKKSRCLCPSLEVGLTYYVMGPDGMLIENEAGQENYKYFWDEQSYIIEYMDRLQYPRGSAEWIQARDQYKFQRNIRRGGCYH